MKINLKLNKIKIIPHLCKRLLNKRYFECTGPANREKAIIFLCFVW